MQLPVLEIPVELVKAEGGEEQDQQLRVETT
jgi:hypothetical protein